MVVAGLLAFVSLLANAEEISCRNLDPRERFSIVVETYTDLSVRQIIREIRPYVEVPVCFVSVPVFCPSAPRGSFWTEHVVSCAEFPAGTQVDVKATHCVYYFMRWTADFCRSEIGKFEVMRKSDDLLR
jgi:hypothetical protein